MAVVTTTNTRNRRRSSTRSVDQDAMVCTTASATKHNEITLMAMAKMRGSSVCAGTSSKQLTRLKATTAAHGSACQRRNRNPSSNSARANSQNTTTLPVETAINTACHGATGGENPAVAGNACAAEPNAKAIARRPAAASLESRNKSAASSSNNVVVPAPNASSICGSMRSRSHEIAQARTILVESTTHFNLLQPLRLATYRAASP